MSVEIRVPQLPESVADATLLAGTSRSVKRCSRDENLADLETDKVVLEVPAPVSGVLREIKVARHGATVRGGELLRDRSRRAADWTAVPAAACRRPATGSGGGGRTRRRAARTARPAARRVIEESQLAPAALGSGRGRSPDASPRPMPEAAAAAPAEAPRVQQPAPRRQSRLRRLRRQPRSRRASSSACR